MREIRAGTRLLSPLGEGYISDIYFHDTQFGGASVITKWNGGNTVLNHSVTAVKRFIFDGTWSIRGRTAADTFRRIHAILPGSEPEGMKLNWPDAKLNDIIFYRGDGYVNWCGQLSHHAGGFLYVYVNMDKSAATIPVSSEFYLGHLPGDSIYGNDES